MAPHLEVVLDATDVDRLATFWGAALGYVPHGSWHQYRSLVDPDGVAPKLILQQVPEPRSGKNRMHLDVHAVDVAGEVDRLVGLGAERVDAQPLQEAGTVWVRMRDPEGNDFCVCRLEPRSG